MKKHEVQPSAGRAPSASETRRHVQPRTHEAQATQMQGFQGTVNHSQRIQQQRRQLAHCFGANRIAPNSTLQKYGGLGLGVPGAIVLAANEVLTHGTQVQNFVNAVGGPQPAPDAPAWFAKGSRFSAHAGARWGNAQTHLHNYTITNALNLLAFDDVADLSAYQQANNGPATNINGVAEANFVHQSSPGSDGYMLTRDAVRGEPEYILFATGIANIQSLFKSSLDTVEPQLFGDDSDIGKRRRLVANGQTIHTADVNDLADFRTTADTPGRARSQSM